MACTCAAFAQYSASLGKKIFQPEQRATIPSPPPKKRLSFVRCTIQRMAEYFLYEASTAATPTPHRYIVYKHESWKQPVLTHLLGCFNIREPHLEIWKCAQSLSERPATAYICEQCSKDSTFTGKQEHWSCGPAGLQAAYILRSWTTGSGFIFLGQTIWKKENMGICTSFFCSSTVT